MSDNNINNSGRQDPTQITTQEWLKFQEWQKQQKGEQTNEPEKQAPKYRYHEHLVNWKDLESYGITKDFLEKKNFLEPMLRGYRTPKLIPITLKVGSLVLRNIDAKLSFVPQPDGSLHLGVHGIKNKPDFQNLYFGHRFSPDDRKNLLTTGNMGRVAELHIGGRYQRSFISYDQLTREIVHCDASKVTIKDYYSGVKLNEDQRRDLEEGRGVRLAMKSKTNKDFEATLQVSAMQYGVQYIFDKKSLADIQELGGVKLTPEQQEKLQYGGTIFVENMKRKGTNETYSSFVTGMVETGDVEYRRYNEETGEIYIPKTINGVAITDDEHATLHKGGTIFLNDMINDQGQEYSAYVRVELLNGRVRTASKPEDFELTSYKFEIPEEKYEHKFTAKERAALQDGKAIFVRGLKHNDEVFDSYIKVNSYNAGLILSPTNPDEKKEASQTQAANQTQSQITNDEEKKNKRNTRQTSPDAENKPKRRNTRQKV